MNKVAVLLTCYNRRVKTTKCLSQLFKLEQNLDVYLVDDGSTDDTRTAIIKEFSAVKLIKGSGNLFWNRGMRMAWEEALKNNYNFYIWLNDDIILYNHAFTEIFECSKLKGNEAIISGIIESKDHTETLYGGFDAQGLIIGSNGNFNEINHLNGNFVLVPKYVVATIGILDPIFHHDLGDVEYGLRAKKNKIGVFTTRMPVGYGEYNPICRERLSGTNIEKRFRRLYAPLGSPPRINFYFRKRYKSLANASLYYIFQHFLNILSDPAVKILFGNKYFKKS